MAAMPATISVVLANPRISVCPTVNTARLGAAAATPLARQTPARETSMSVRRPFRSARALATRAMRTPAREMAKAVPRARSDAPNDRPT